MKSDLQVIFGALAGFMIGGFTVVGANQAIQAIQNTEIKVSLNDQVQTFKDETTGEVQYPITYHDRTYLPLRNVAQLAGLNVDYDATTNTAKLSNKGNTSNQSDSSSKTNGIISLGQKNALNKAKSYLAFTAFSEKGLKEQLEFEGFSSDEAQYGVNNCGANWNEQAAKKAKTYLDFSSFSRQGLKEQLEFEGFTNEQAEYGVTAVGY